MSEPEALNDRDHAMLQFERAWLNHSAHKVQAIRDTFGITAARYYQLLNGTIEKPAALALDPLLVHRLIRSRDERTTARAARTFKGRTAAD